MTTLKTLLRDNGLDRVAAQIEAASKPSVFLSTGEAKDSRGTRLGGRPNLPAELQWPTWKGSPLAFVAQLELSELPQIPGLLLPRTGALYFFYEGGEQAWGFSPEDKGSSLVLYSEDSVKNHPERDFPETSLQHLRFKGVPLIAQSIEETVPGVQDVLFQTLLLDTDEREFYWKFLEKWSERTPQVAHRVGGYPDCVQGDPKLEAQLVSHGLYCGNKSGYDEGKVRGLWPAAADWELLLQVDSEEKAEMMWGDVGRIYFLIRRTDLEQRHFDKSWLIFQCY